MTSIPFSLSIVMPAKNEADSLRVLLPELKQRYPHAEVIVVNDASDDDTESVCLEHDVRVENHPYSKGNGAAIKSGARAASGDVIVFMDADGQHQPADIESLLKKIDTGYDLVVGARTFNDNASFARGIANKLYNWFASWVTGYKIYDLTSGFRAVRKEKFEEFINILPNGFSYPTTSTMAFLRVGYSVGFTAINLNQRNGDSHIHPIKDGIKFLLIIFRVGVLYSPLKIFFPASFLIFSTGVGYYLYTFLSQGRFTNMGILLFIVAVLIFLIGLVSEQITFLIYSQNHKS